MEESVDSLLEKTKGNLFFKSDSGFLGALLCNMSFRWDDKIPTTQTNGLELVWNPDFYRSLDVDTRVTVLAHELWHVAFQHPSRGHTLDPETYNDAADYVINLLLQEHGYYMGGFPYLMERRFRGMSTEEVYDILIQEKGYGVPAPENKLGNDIAKCTAEIDQLDSLAKVVSAMTAASISGADAGKIPGEVSFIVEKFLNPVLPWETLLNNFFNELTDQVRSYARPNRRYEDPILPGKVGTSGLEHLIYYLDISGSVTDDEILRFNSEVKFVKEEFQPEKLTLVTFDTHICDEYVFEKDEEFEKIIVTGRGGTRLGPVYDHANKHQPTAIIIFTDLRVKIPKKKPVPYLVWICANNPDREVPYGKLIHLPREETT